MAGYSGTPLATKLGIKPGTLVALFNAPTRFERTLDGLPADAVIARDPRSGKGLNVIVAFVTTEADAARRISGLKPRLDPAGGLWIAWPKKSSGVPTDVTEDVIRRIALEAGLVDNKVCAIDETWSGLRLVIRLKDRPAAKGKAKR